MANESKVWIGITGIAVVALALLYLIGDLGLTGNVISKSDNVEIGAISALTGPSALHGQNVKDGVEIAIEHINLEGGINGKRLEVIFEDGMCDIKQGVNAIKKLINIDDVKVVLGPMCSSVSMAAAPIAEENEVIMLTSVASVPALKYEGDFIFRNRVSGEAHSNKMAEFAYNELDAKTASIFYINLDNGIGYRDSFIQRFEELGGRVLNSESYNKEDLEFRTQLSKIKDLRPDVLYFAGQIHVGEIVNQIRELGIESQIIGPITMETPELIDIAGEVAEGIYYSYSAFDPDSYDPIVANYQDKYEERFGKRSEAFAANSYDATMLIADALRKCGEETSCIRDYLYAVKDYPGVSGLTSFDEFGEVTKPLIIKTVKNGEFVRFG